MAKKLAHDPVDAHIGSRIRLRRKQLGVSQTELGKAIDLTFQQVQKYEIGGNRVSAATLFRIAMRLAVPISFFFDGLDGAPTQVEPASNDVQSIMALKAALTVPEIVNIQELPRRQQRAVATIIQGLFERR